MISLFEQNSDVKLVKFLNARKAEFAILASPEFISDIYYATRDDKDPLEFEFSLYAIAMDTLNTFNESEEENRTFIVADGDGERLRVRQLRERYSNIKFVGLAETFLPALMAQKISMIPEIDDMDLHAPLDIVMLFAPPRSGSSLVSDVLIDLGVGNTAEHLRNTLIEILESSYKFDKAYALRVFLHLSQVDGWVGTKLISHFLQDYFQKAFNSGLLAEMAKDGYRVHPIFLEREDMVLQAISGHMASSRGIWHVVDQKSSDRLGNSADVKYDFDGLLSRYLSYKSQDAFLKTFRDVFPDTLVLKYEDDCFDTPALSKKLAEHLKVPVPDTLKTAAKRQKIASDTNVEFRDRFEQDFKTIFGSNL